MGGRGASSHRNIGGGFQHLTSINQAEHWIQQQGWFMNGSRISLRGVDLNAAKGIIAAYKQVFERFPQLKGAFEGVLSFNLGSGTYADCNLATGTIRVSDSMYRSVQALKQQYESDIRSNWHPVGTDWSAIVTHEIGHAIDGYISKKLRTSNAQYYDWYHNADNLQSIVAGKLNINPTKSNISKEVSRYGATKSVEWFAESFAEGMRSSNPRRMAKEFMVELENVLRRIR